jgi:hypothetical protein
MEMELADLLRISVLLDHHRNEATERADGAGEGVNAKLFTQWSGEAGELNRKLLAAIAEYK